MISLFLDEAAQSEVLFFVFEKTRQGNLLWSIATETIELVDLPEFFHQVVGRNAIAQLPASAVINLSKRKADKTSFEQLRIFQNAFVFLSIEDEVFIYLVADD